MTGELQIKTVSGEFKGVTGSYVSEVVNIGPWCSLSTFSGTVWHLLMAGFCLLMCVGCKNLPYGEAQIVSPEVQSRASELSSGYSKQVEKIGEKQDEALTILREQSTALAAIKAKVDAIPVVSPVANGKESDPESALEPQETERDSQHTPSIPVSAPAVRLQFYTQDRCRDCTIQQPKAEAAADELGVSLEVFDLKEHDDAFTQAKITVTPTTVIVIDDAIRVRFVGVVSAAIIAERAKSELSGQQQVQMIVMPDRSIASVKESHARRVELHNKLHGGGNWTWPGDLATHLRQAHGVNTSGGAPLTGAMFPNYATTGITSQRVSVRSLPRRVSYVGRANYSTRQSCPTGSCPTR